MHALVLFDTCMWLGKGAKIWILWERCHLRGVSFRGKSSKLDTPLKLARSSEAKCLISGYMCIASGRQQCKSATIHVAMYRYMYVHKTLTMVCLLS